MTIGIRGKLFFASFSLVVVVALASGAYLELTLRAWLGARTEAELTRHAAQARVAFLEAAAATSSASVDSLADRLGRAAGARLTIIRGDGKVLGDSVLTATEVARIESHADRPEVRAALASGKGSCRRYSTTLDTAMLYVALRYVHAAEEGVQRGVVRMGMPLTDAEEAVVKVRFIVLGAGLLGVVVALLMSGLASHLLSRDFRRLVAGTWDVARGEGTRVSVRSHDELGSLAGSINHMAAALERTVAALASERDRFERVLEEMGEAVLALSEGQRITVVNRAAQVLLGIDAGAKGRPLVDVARVPALIELAEQGLRSPAAAELELPHPQVRTVSARATPLRAAGGTVVVMHDVTELRRLEKVRQDFVANVSHELRTPVSVILANAETLLQGALSDAEQAPRFVQALHRNAERLSRLISDLLDLSRLDSGRTALDLVHVDVARAFERALETVGTVAADAGLQVEIQSGEELAVVADEQALDHVLMNLLDNAVKYTPRGGRVVMRAVADGDRVRMEIRDDGPGIEARHRQRIFERFYRVDPGRSRAVGGTGLGLAIVKHLAGSMHGRVGVEAAEPHGSVFWVTLPAAGGAQCSAADE